MVPAYSVDASANSVTYRGLMAEALLGPISLDRDRPCPGAAWTAEANLSLSSSFATDMWGRADAGDWLITAMAAKSQRRLREMIKGHQVAAPVAGNLAPQLVQPSLETSESLAEEPTQQTDGEEEAFLSIAVAFHAFPRVKSIYVQKFRSDIQVFTVLAIQAYDDGLMDQLLDREWQIRQVHSQLFFDFAYPIGSEAGTPDFIHPAARCIFVR